MARPEYVNDNEPSVATWQEACVISQEWADGARQAAAHKRLLRAWLSVILLLVFALVLTAVVLITTDTVVL
jgi:lipopolysaccharide/colanic/teichoic acid biosynthesis glycosyltransferase